MVAAGEGKIMLQKGELVQEQEAAEKPEMVPGEDAEEDRDDGSAKEDDDDETVESSEEPPPSAGRPRRDKKASEKAADAPAPKGKKPKK